jgi:hypothetical protein
MPGPEHTEQRAATVEARVEARKIREHRDWLIGEVASGALSLDGIFEQDDRDRRSGMAKVVVLAEKVPGVGKVRARRAMGELGRPEDARWGEVDRSTLRELWAAMADAATRPVRTSR